MDKNEYLYDEIKNRQIELDCLMQKYKEETLDLKPEACPRCYNLKTNTLHFKDYDVIKCDNCGHEVTFYF